MSNGPIQRWRDGYKVPDVSNAKKVDTIHAPGDGIHSDCGRRGVQLALREDDVNCSDCIAARNADMATEDNHE